MKQYDVVVVGSGHNGLVAAAYLARAGKTVLVLERLPEFGGAATSARVFPDYDAQLSRYAYLVSLFPQVIADELELSFEARRRRIASFTPWTDRAGRQRGLVLSNVDEQQSRDSLLQMTGSDAAWDSLQKLRALETAIADLIWPTLLEPLRQRRDFERQLQTDLQREAWRSFVQEPLGRVIERYADHDALRGLLMTDGKIGVLTHPHDETLQQNRCFLYHIIGNGTGEWRVPVGGMKSLRDSLVNCCRMHGVVLLTSADVRSVSPDGGRWTVEYLSSDVATRVAADSVLINAGPRTFAELLGESWTPQPGDEGSAVKINMLLERLPKLKADIASEVAFCGSFHVNEGYEQMQASFRAAASGQIPDPAPGEVYCHTLTDTSIISAELRDRGLHTLTLFGLDMPYRLFANDHDARRQKVLDLYLNGLDELCAESFRDCLAKDRDGRPCIEIKTPQDLERDVSLDLGNIFHNALSWFFTDNDEDAGLWGVETQYPGIYRAGSSAVRGGAVSGIPGRNSAMALLNRNR